jgi:hypothetical protein
MGLLNIFTCVGASSLRPNSCSAFLTCTSIFRVNVPLMRACLNHVQYYSLVSLWILTDFSLCTFSDGHSFKKLASKCSQINYILLHNTNLLQYTKLKMKTYKLPENMQQTVFIA